MNRKQVAPYLGWVFLLVTAVVISIVTPPVFDLHPRRDIALALLVIGALLLASGLARGVEFLIAVGAAILWVEIILGLTTQVAPFATPFIAALWLPFTLLILALLVWLVLLIRRGRLLIVVGVVSVLVIVALSGLRSAAPPVARTVSLFWLAVDSNDRLYATETDFGEIWVLEPDGTRGYLWPRGPAAADLGPGLNRVDRALQVAQDLGLQLTNPGGLIDRDLMFCGIAVDPQDRLYVVDPDGRRLMQFSRDGNLLAQWNLADDFIPAYGCLAADRAHVYVADGKGAIYVFDPDGDVVAKWPPAKASNGLAADGQGRLYILHEKNITVHQSADGSIIRQITLPTPQEGLIAPYGAIVVRADGEILVADLNKDQVLRFDAGGRALSPLGVEGNWPGQFAGPGGKPGQFAGVGALAQDASGRIYVSDSLYRLVERFSAQGEVEAIISVPEQVANEKPLSSFSQ